MAGVCCRLLLASWGRPLHAINELLLCCLKPRGAEMPSASQSQDSICRCLVWFVRLRGDMNSSLRTHLLRRLQQEGANRESSQRPLSLRGGSSQLGSQIPYGSTNHAAAHSDSEIVGVQTSRPSSSSQSIWPYSMAARRSNPAEDVGRNTGFDSDCCSDRMWMQSLQQEWAATVERQTLEG